MRFSIDYAAVSDSTFRKNDSCFTCDISEFSLESEKIAFLNIVKMTVYFRFTQRKICSNFIPAAIGKILGLWLRLPFRFYRHSIGFSGFDNVRYLF